MALSWTTNDPADVFAAAADVRAWLQPPSWHEDAACRGQGVAGYVTPERGAWRTDSCARCQVRLDCAGAALAVLDAGGRPVGVWAGVVLAEGASRSAVRERLQQAAGRTA